VSSGRSEKKAEAEASVITRQRRTGLKVYTETAGSAVARLDAALDFPSRLKVLRERSASYFSIKDVEVDGVKKKKIVGIKEVAEELEWIEEVLQDQHMDRWVAVSFAMLALERGLDLLDTGQHLKAIEKAEKFKSHGRGPGKMRRLVEHLLKKHPDPKVSHRALWGLAEKSPQAKRLKITDFSPVECWVEGQGEVRFTTFSVHISQVRKALKISGMSNP